MGHNIALSKNMPLKNWSTQLCCYFFKKNCIRTDCVAFYKMPSEIGREKVFIYCFKQNCTTK